MKTHYRKAVTSHSPGLPRFAATLGKDVRIESNPTGVVPRFRSVKIVVTPLGLEPFHNLVPRVAAKPATLGCIP